MFSPFSLLSTNSQSFTRNKAFICIMVMWSCTCSEGAFMFIITFINKRPSSKYKWIKRIPLSEYLVMSKCLFPDINKVVLWFWLSIMKDFYTRFYPLLFLSYLYSWDKASISLFNVECQTRELLVPKSVFIYSE